MGRRGRIALALVLATGAAGSAAWRALAPVAAYGVWTLPGDSAAGLPTGLAAVFASGTGSGTGLDIGPGAGRCVILLHGLARTSDSMRPLARAIAARGVPVVGVDYPSRLHPVETLAPKAVGLGLAACRDTGARRIDFVTHSMGAILLRSALADGAPPELGRIVMLAPPNRGSEVVDALRDVPGFAAFNGPAGLQLGTGADELPAHLGSTDTDVAVIAGTRTINVLLSQLLPNPDDGKVSAPRTRLDGMCGWLAVPATHPLIVKKPLVIDEILKWLESGLFTSPEAEYPDCPARD